MALVLERSKVFKEVGQLNRIDQFYLLEYLVKTLAKSEGKAYNLTNLKGLGKGLWTKNGIDSFISKEREAWD